jgi:hypothetical protein
MNPLRLDECDEADRIDAIDELICATLRGETAFWPETKHDRFVGDFLLRGGYHGALALLHHRLNGASHLYGSWPKAVLEACRNAAIGQAMWELRHRELLQEALARLSASGAKPLLFKGTALAYDLYPAPFLRSRGDTDMIVSACAGDRAGATLEELGFSRGFSIDGDMIHYAANYSRDDPETGAHDLDLHWRINNAQALSRLFSHEELYAEAQPLPKLCPTAVAAGRVHALVLACMHRAVHKQAPYHVDQVEHYGGDRLVWLYDIHLLVEALTPSQQEAFLEVAGRKGLRKICLEGIELARARFRTRASGALLKALARPAPAEDASRYLEGSFFYRYWADFVSIDGARNKLKFLSQLFFPSRDYMRRRFPEVRPSWLPWLYARRAVSGVVKQLRRTKAFGRGPKTGSPTRG